MTNTIDVMKEPKGDEYRQLISLAAEMCTSFSLVWRDAPSDPSTKEVELSLKPFLIREERTDEWPGTKLFGHQATVRHYRLAPESIAILGQAQGLYAWESPSLPEDLVFYTKDGTVWLASIAHESDAWFEASPEMEAILRNRLPTLGLVFQTDED